MTLIKINLAKIQDTVLKKKEKQKKITKTVKGILYIFIILVVTMSTFSIKVIFSSEGVVENIKTLPLFKQITHLAKSADRKLIGEDKDRINILLLGIGGTEHTAGSLADTIILASIKPSTSQAALLSIPRDLLVPIPGYGWRKINNVNAFAEMSSPGSGAFATAKIVSKVLEQEIPYYIRVDFISFVKFIDHIGGIDVYVENTLEDYSYPSHGKETAWPISERYEHLYIEKGWHHMNGDLALKYARSRHALGVEGSDFARAKRQQKIITALKDKILSVNVLLNPKKISELINDLKKNISTNLELWEMLRLASIGRTIDTQNIIQKVLDNSQDGLLYSAITEDGAYVLQPRAGDFSDIQKLAKNIFYLENNKSNTSTNLLQDSKDKQRDTKKEENAKIEIQNGTTIEGLARSTSKKLSALGFRIIKIGNAKKQGYEKTVIYDLSNGKNPNTIRLLKEQLNANISVHIPAWLIEPAQIIDPNLKDQDQDITYSSEADILVILGSDISESL